MKSFILKISVIFILVFQVTIVAYSQVPSGFSYQAVVRDGTGKVRANQMIALNLSIIRGNAVTGTEVFTEPHAPISNEMGYISVVIGSQNSIDFKNIDWSNGPYFLRVEIDNIEMGTTELLSVPFAKIADIAYQAISVDYSNVQNKPNWSDTIQTKIVHNLGYSYAETDDLLNTKADKNLVYSITQVDSLFTHKVETNMYTTAQVDALLTPINSSLTAKANTSDVYTKTQSDAQFSTITNTYSKTQSDVLLLAKPDSSVVYTRTVLDSRLALKANVSDVYTKTSVDNFLLNKANTADLSSVAFSNSYTDLNNKPTGLSAFVNDANYATVSMIPTEAVVDSYVADNGYILGETDPTFASSVAKNILASDITNWNSKTNFDGQYSSLVGTPNLSSYALQATTYTKTEVNTALALKANTSALGAVALSNNYVDLTNKPSKLSDFTNDANFATIAMIPTETTVDTYVANNGYITSELDPNFNASAAKNITAANITYWNAKSDFDGAYTSLTGKPDLSVYSLITNTYTKTDVNSALALKANISSLGAVATSNNYVDLSNKPTLVSSFTNDANYATISMIPTESVVDTYVSNNGYISTETDPLFSAAAAKGITAGDITYWNAKSDFDGQYASLIGKPDLSVYSLITNTYTKAEVNTALALKANISSLGAVATSNNYNDLTSKPTIPTKVSDLVNDAGFVTTDNVLSEAEVDAYVANNGYISAETDPFFNASAAKGITAANITNWNAKSNFDGAYTSLTGVPDLSIYAQNTGVYSRVYLDAALALKANSASLSAVATSGSYGDLSGKPSIPSDLGDLTNAAGFIKISDLTDNSITNEIQTLSLSTNQLSISGTGGNTVTFTNWDTDATNDVTLTGVQTITGNKTFTGTVTVPSPVSSSDAANKGYVDALQSRVVVLETEKTALENQLAVMNSILLDAGLQGTIKDIDGNVYKTIKIGSLVWMTENLKTTTYKDGGPINYPGTSTATWTSTGSGAYAWYSDNVANKDIYGALYNWHAVSTGKLCPTGWHVATDAEWQSLETSLGMADAANTGDRGTTEGTELKSTTLWDAGGIAGTNTSQFSALPGGSRSNSSGGYNNSTYYGLYWTGTPDTVDAWSRTIGFDVETVYREVAPRNTGMSVRCVKN